MDCVDSARYKSRGPCMLWTYESDSDIRNYGCETFKCECLGRDWAFQGQRKLLNVYPQVGSFWIHVPYRWGWLLNIDMAFSWQILIVTRTFVLKSLHRVTPLQCSRLKWNKQDLSLLNAQGGLRIIGALKAAWMLTANRSIYKAWEAVDEENIQRTDSLSQSSQAETQNLIWRWVNQPHPPKEER
jgi:hypothetical protein